jgi:purine-binding chemotaxis protein CheW
MVGVDCDDKVFSVSSRLESATLGDDKMQASARVSEATPAVETIPSQIARAGKYLIFSLAGEEFGAEVLKIKEIMGMQNITAVPNTASCVKGVINLRGQVIPVLDLRIKFNLPPVEYTQRTCIVVVDTQVAAKSTLMGAIVDGVAEVLTLVPEDIVNTPDFGNGSDSPYLLGMAKVKGKVKILIDIQQVLGSSDSIELDKALATQAN